MLAGGKHGTLSLLGLKIPPTNVNRTQVKLTANPPFSNTKTGDSGAIFYRVLSSVSPSILSGLA
jgi:hypothetical protein